MSKQNLSVSLPPKMRLLVEREAKRGKRSKRSRSAVIHEALQVYFRLRRIGFEEGSAQERRAVGFEEGSAQERRAVADGRSAYKQDEFVTLETWQHAVGLGDY